MRKKNITEILKTGGVGVMPTDTIYGIVGSALNKKTVARIYKLRKRNLNKPMIILIASMDDLALFDIKPNAKTKQILKKLWPGKVSIILPTSSKLRGLNYEYLHRGTKSLAFRLPRPIWLRKLLQKTGPLVAPSANWEGEEPAKTIREAKKYFGRFTVSSPIVGEARRGKYLLLPPLNRRGVDFYVDAGKLESEPSTLIKIEKERLKVLRARPSQLKLLRRSMQGIAKI